MQSFWSPIVSKLTPYVAGEQIADPDIVKLNTNENPYPPSPQAAYCLHNLPVEALRLYPDPQASALKQSIAQYYQIDPSFVFAGNGSDEVLAHVFQALLIQEKPLLMPDITYSFYPVYCQLFGVNYDLVALNANFDIDVADFKRPSSAIILANPNAPTGRLLTLQEIEQLLQQDAQRLVIIDEAYIDFGGQTAVTLCNRFSNLLVIQTLSKSRSLAALRIGFAFGQPHLIEALNRVKDSFNSYPISRVAIDCGVAAIEDHHYFEQTCKAIIEQRQWLTQQLQKRGFSCTESYANFVFCQHHTKLAEDIYQKLKQKKVLVRHFNKPRINNFLRITVGNQAQNRALVNALDSIFEH